MPLLVFVLVVAWPVTEIYVAVLVADQIGWGSTLLLILGLSLLGVWVMRSTVRRTRAAMAGLDPRRVPPPGSGVTAAHASLRFVAGFLLFVPGLVSDAIGLVLLIPLVRTIVIALVGQAVVRRFAGTSSTLTRVRLWSGGDVVTGEVVDPFDDQPGPRTPPELPPS